MAPAVFFSLALRVLTCFAATSTLAFADDLPGLYFDLNSLIWMLIGALGWGAVSYWLGRRSRRSSDFPSAFVPRSVPISPANNFLAGEREKDGESGEKSENLSEYLTPLDETTTVTVEEVSNIAEQVDLFLMLGRQEMAISMLLARIGAEDDGDPRIWFKLLDIYHAREDRANFEKLANDIRVRFNVALPSWEDSTLQAEGRHGLEHFPHLLARISDDWGTSSCLSYLQSLVKDTRSGERAGFNEDAFREVMFLIGVLEQKTGL
jgi:hypothetical protein